MKNIFTIFIIIIFLKACSTPSENYLAKKTALDNIKSIAKNSCYLNTLLDDKNDWLLAVLDNKQSILNLKELEIFNEIAEIYKTCPKHILLVNYINNIDDYKFMYKKNQLIYNYLANLKINNKNILSIYCSKKDINLEIKTLVIFLNTPQNYHYFDCLDDYK
jgi:hypothetical protein